MELKRIRHWLFLIMLVRSGRYLTRTREELTHTDR
ncbi:hypothetical protein HDG35_003400 [Paraburkholderia sp. JPY681]|uniref:Uncharacterized protein n=1 Tax=Paraburkholderia atlantica TaxID=2654982 RepID=D5WCL2_PARAM|nr:hypothetical protein BC1002_2566 [Paraburkholderia atlantica]MBB5507126.1 hypothetical protein [Paraburkholderia atlantica]